MTKISVIIPTLNGGNELPALMEALQKQNRTVDEIIVVDSESDDETVAFCKANKSINLLQIARKDFDHGRTRDMALRKSIGDIVVFLTQDALPANTEFLDNLIAPLQDETIAVSTGRQIAKNNATKMEQFVRSFNYPAESHIRSKDDISRMGIKTFFCSDVCAAYNRKIYLKLGGFDYPVQTNEDMFFAAAAIRSGYRIAYTADAVVYHSHNLTLKEQYRRNYIQGYEIERHRELLNNVESTSEGIKLVRYVSGELLKRGHFFSFIYFGLDCCARIIGNKQGKAAFLKVKAEKKLKDETR